MKKVISKILLLSLFVFAFMSPVFVSNVVKADIGFDGGFDSGYDSGYDSDWGGSSWDDDDDYYSGGGYSGEDIDAEPMDVLLALLIEFVLVGVMVLIVFIALNRNRASKNRYTINQPISTYNMPVDDSLNMDVYLMYKELNNAWMNKDLDPVRHLLTDELYNMYLMQLDTLIENKQTNIMKDYLFISGHVASRVIVGDVEKIKVIFRIRCKDYIISDETGKVVRGKASDVLDYIYELDLVRDNGKKNIICPSCGAQIRGKDGVVCSHCGTVVHINTSQLRLANKKILHQSRYRG